METRVGSRKRKAEAVCLALWNINKYTNPNKKTEERLCFVILQSLSFYYGLLCFKKTISHSLCNINTGAIDFANGEAEELICAPSWGECDDDDDNGGSFDATEMRMEVSSNPMCQRATWSQYKHSNTVKFWY